MIQITQTYFFGKKSKKNQLINFLSKDHNSLNPKAKLSKTHSQIFQIGLASFHHVRDEESSAKLPAAT